MKLVESIDGRLARIEAKLGIAAPADDDDPADDQDQPITQARAEAMAAAVGGKDRTRGRA